MLHIEQRLDLFRDMIGCCHNLYLWSYDQSMNLLKSNCPKANILNELFVSDKLFAELPDKLTETNAPVLMSTELGLTWITVPYLDTNKLQYIYVLGPFFMYDISASQIEVTLRDRKLDPELQKNVVSFLRDLPIISLIRSSEYSQMFYFCVTGQQISTDSITFLDNHSNTISVEKLETVHGTYEAEKEMLRLVREGDLNYRSHLQQIVHTGQIGKISDRNALRQLKNMLLVSITLFSRAAMEGGLPPETAYSLADQYFLAVEKNNSVKSLVEINSTMQDDFVQRVHQFRQNKNLSKPIRICVEQMRSRLEENISLESFSKELSYSTYYLSKKFKNETGQTFKDYLRQLRLERAKYMLRNTDISILEISERLQFCSPSYFSDTFRKEYGISPTSYREQL